MSGLNPIERAKTKPQSRPLAVRAMCCDCMGAGGNTNTAELIRECRSTACPLHAVRPYQPAGDGRRFLAAAIKDKCFLCVGGADDPRPSPKVRVRDCVCADCPLHPVRPWQEITGRVAATDAAE